MKKKISYPVDISKEYFFELINDEYPELDNQIVQSLVESLRCVVSLKIELDLITGKSKILSIK